MTGRYLRATTSKGTQPKKKSTQGRQLTGLTAGLPGSIHRDLDGFVVEGQLWWMCGDADGQSEALS